MLFAAALLFVAHCAAGALVSFTGEKTGWRQAGRQAREPPATMPVAGMYVPMAPPAAN